MTMNNRNHSSFITLLSVVRLPQWVKNGFVVAPLLFSGKFSDPAMIWRNGAAFLSFCLMSSAVYIFNDLCDRESDRRHPNKQHRPIAAGIIRLPQAVVIMVVAALLSLATTYFLGGRCAFLLGLYALINIVYSLGMKHVAILDVMAIASGFVLRIWAGSVAIGVMPSHWLILCTIMISMFLGFTKRRAEMVAMDVEQRREVLKDYSILFLDQVIAMVTGATLICYALYTVDSQTVAMFKTKAMLLTVPCVMYGLFRYIYIIYHLKEGQDPSRTLSRDWPMMLNLVIWVILALGVVRYGEQLSQWF